MSINAIEDLLGGPDVLGQNINSQMDLFELTRKGLTKKALVNLAQYMHLSLASMTTILSITERTLQRKKDSDKLSSFISDQILQLADVYTKGEEVFGTREQVSIWLTKPNKALGYKKPMELLSSSYGVQMVHDVLGRIEHGIYS